MIATRFFCLLLAGVLSVAAASPAPGQEAGSEYEGAAALGLALRGLDNTKRVLMVGAHPDDESTPILAALALGQGAEVAYLSLTRGEGGQNGIGPELQEALGLLRSEELLAARRLDGARQYFTRAYDYGFSKSADEAFRHWPPNEVLADLVAAVRDFRPDLVVSVFSGTPADGHGQHQAAGILAREAFEAAGDPARFPEQIARGLRPYAAPKLYQARWRPDEGAKEHLATGAVDPLLGRSHYQVAMASRSRHRSQDMGRLLEPGPRSSAFRLVEVSGMERGRAEGALFAGVDTTLRARAVAVAPGEERLLRRLEDYEQAVVAARRAFNPLSPGGARRELARALTAVRLAGGLVPDLPGGAELRFRIEAEEAEAEAALALASGVLFDAVADDEAVVPGQSLELSLSLWNGGREAVAVGALEPVLPAGWVAEPLDPAPAAVMPGALAERRFRVRVPADAEPTRPYYLRRPRRGDLYEWPAGSVGVPFEAPALRARATVAVDGVELPVEREATYRGLDRRSGEFRRPVRVVPAVSVSLEPRTVIVPVGSGDPEPLEVTVSLRGEAPEGVAGSLRLHAPAGWVVAPERMDVALPGPGEARALRFRVRPPAGVGPGEHTLAAEFEAASGVFREGYSLVDYEHVRPRALYEPASATVHALDVRLPRNLRVGYVEGAGDAVPEAIRQLGLPVETLGPERLASGDLGVFDVIVTGIRAYEVRPDLVAHNERLFDYVRAGGTLLVQYNKYEFDQPGLAPYPLRIARPHDRVTDETAPVRLLDPDHPALAGPNRITERDFEGWIQERGLYFPREWDERYTPLLEMSDPGEEGLRGGLLVAPLGEGTYAYTGLAFFRQLPAGVPGAYRLFANLLALGADQ